jgi:hypothetical protein
MPLLRISCSGHTVEALIRLYLPSWVPSMADVFTKEKRSEVMSRIRPNGNEETELALIELPREQGLKA